MEENEDNNNENKSDKENLIEYSSDREEDPKFKSIGSNFMENMEGKKKRGSIQVVFSLWNTMIGSSIVSIPYNVYKAGIIPTVVLGLIYGYICYYTCSIVVKLSGKEEEFGNVVFCYFNLAFGKKMAKFGKVLQITFNLMINIGATFIYFLIINQNLYPCLCLFLRVFNIDLNEGDLEPHFNQFSLIYCALIVSVLVFPLLILKDMSFLSKFNSKGFLFVTPLLIYAIYIGFKTIFTNNLHFEYKANTIDGEDRNLFLFGEEPGMIAGTLSLGLFCHSVVLNLLKDTKNPENNQRDLFFGYLCVSLTYIIIGIMGYIGFSGSGFDPEFKDNWFQFYKSDNYIILALRILNVIQLISIFPILFFSVRKQLFSSFCENFLNSTLPIVIFTIILLLLCLIVIYFCYDILGKLISFIGATTALVLIYAISPITNMIYYYIRHLSLQERNERFKEMNDPDSSKNKNNILPEDIKKPLLLKPLKATFFYMSMILIIFIGILNLVLQFLKVNFFNIHIDKN
jgi:sodium-coupled neutral amino acid transporter 9